MDILHMNCQYPPLYLSPKMLNHHYPLLIIIDRYLYSILLQKCLIMVELFVGSLQTTDMQFAYKAKHSTTLCIMVYLKTLHHYVNNGSNVYRCLLDASRAFGRIHHGKLFTILLSKQVGLPAFIIRYLRDSYIRQMSRALWDTCCSAYFTMSNGIKQGGGGGVTCNTVYHLHSTLINYCVN